VPLRACMHGLAYSAASRARPPSPSSASAFAVFGMAVAPQLLAGDAIAFAATMAGVDPKGALVARAEPAQLACIRAVQFSW
jgi:hypothetical protein